MGLSKEQFLKEFDTLQTEDSAAFSDDREIVDYYNRNANKISNVTGGLRAVGQGLSLGFGDEIEAYIRSIGSDKTYSENVENIRKELEEFKKQNPALAYGGEIAGSVVSSLTPAGLVGKGVQGATKLATLGKVGKLGTVGKTIGTAGVEGSIYGAGTAGSGEGETLKGAAGGGLAGMAMGGIFSSLLPRSTDAAKKLLKMGVRPTVGQTFTEGAAGKLTKGFEESSTSYIGYGRSVADARANALSQFNKLVMTEAVSPALSKAELNSLAKQIKDVNGKEAFNIVSETISKKYDDVLETLSIPSTGLNKLENRFDDILGKEYGNIIDKSDKKKAYSIFMKHLKKTTKKIDGDEVLSGKNAKQFETALRKEAEKYNKAGGSDANIGEVFDEIRKDFKNIVTEFDPNNALADVNKAYAGIVPIKKAVVKANKTKGIFTTEQFLNSLAEADMSVGKTMTAKGKTIFGDLPEIGQEVLGKTIPDSGTASRLVSGNLLGSGGLPEFFKTLGLSALGDVAYSPITQKTLRGLLGRLDPSARAITPYAAGQLSNNLLNTRPETEEERLLNMMK